MTRYMEQTGAKDALETAGKTVSLAGIIIGLVLFTLVSTGASLKEVQLPVQVFTSVGIGAVVFGILELVTT